MSESFQKTRSYSVDFLRGLVIILMALDHTQFFWYQHGLPNDGLEGFFFSYTSAAHHITRYLSHLCAPTFLFLAGMMLAWKNNRIWMIQRGLVLILLQFTLENIAWGPTYYIANSGYAYFGILSCLGVGMWICALLSYLRPVVILLTGLGLFTASQLINARVPQTSSWLQVLAIITYAPTLNHQYPMTSLFTLLQWSGFMVLGFYMGLKHCSLSETVGKVLKTRYQISLREICARARARSFALWAKTMPARPARRSSELCQPSQKAQNPSLSMILLGTLCLALFFLIRSRYGFPLFSHNYFVFSKYPPDLSFLTLTSGIMFLVLGLAMQFEAILHHKIFSPIILFGQTSLFFYIVHLYLYGAVSHIYGRINVGICAIWAIWAVGLVILYFICKAYQQFKAQHPNSILRLI